MAVQFALIQIETRQFAMFPEKCQSNQLEVRSQFQFAVADDNSRIRCIGTFTYYDKEQMVLVCEVGCHFAIKPESWDEMKLEDGSFEVPKGLLQHFATILVGTTRGILVCKTEGTILQNHLLPLIDLTKIIIDGMPVSRTMEK